MFLAPITKRCTVADNIKPSQLFCSQCLRVKVSTKIRKPSASAQSRVARDSKKCSDLTRVTPARVASLHALATRMPSRPSVLVKLNQKSSAVPSRMSSSLRTQKLRIRRLMGTQHATLTTPYLLCSQGTSQTCLSLRPR